MQVDAVVVSYNSRKHLRTAVENLSRLEGVRAVVVDNASTDSTAAYIRERWPRVRLIASESNLGFAQANNVGIHNTSSELVLLVNPDTIVTGTAEQAQVQTGYVAPRVEQQYDDEGNEITTWKFKS